MDQDIAADFIALSPRAKVAVLSRTIHMETIHVRAAHLDYPDDAKRIYLASEFMHRLSGFIMALAYNPETFQHDATCAAMALIDGIRPHGQAYLEKLREWVADAQSIR
jgi:hypothetical protein